MADPIIHHALIMAAGRGNRMRPFTDLIPKPMLPYRGDTLIGNSLKELKGCVDQVHITVGYKKAMLSEYLMTRGVDTLINTEGHNNAWWIKHTFMKYIDEPVLVLTTDNITKIDMDFLGSEYQRLDCPSGMLVPVRPIKGIEGDYIFHEQGIVTEIARDKCSDIYCSGIQVLNPYQIAQDLPEDLEDFYSIWRGLIGIKQLKVSAVYPYTWFSVDTLEQAAGLDL